MSGSGEHLVADAELLGADAQAMANALVVGDEVGDFAAMVRRAAELSSDTVSPQDVEEADDIAARSDAELTGAVNFGTLDDFLDDAADFVARQRTDDVPPLPQPAAPRTRRGTLVALSAAMSVAAAVVLAVWLGGLRGTADRGRDGGERDFASAVDRAQMPDTGGQSSTRRPQPPQKPRPPTPPPAPEPAPEPAPAAEVQAPDAAPAPKASPRQTKEERLNALDAQARAAWKNGDLATAQRKLEALIRSGGRRSIADIAYGDLFSVTRQRGDRKALRAHWRRYAKAFPSGRYIDDARAGLCRAAAASEQRACWQRYLDDRPAGTYHQHARDVLARDE